MRIHNTDFKDPRLGAGADVIKYPRLQVLTLTEVIQHLLSASHRLRYLECFFPSVRRKFAKVPNIKFWKPAAFDFLESVVAREDGQTLITVQVTVTVTVPEPELEP